MKKLLFPFITFILSFSVEAQIRQQVWTSNDRENLLAGLTNSQSDILKEVQQLNEKQIHFKIDSSKWSIAEVLEHIGVYEELLYWDLLNNQYTNERPDLVDSVKSIDSAMTAYATDPTKGQAPFAVQPMGRFQNKEDLIKFFCRFRNEVIRLIQESKADFRLHFIFTPPDWGIWHIRDLHQYTLLWIAHTQRHLKQILTIKSNINCPR